GSDPATVYGTAFDPCQPGHGADRCDARVPKARHLIRGEATTPLPVTIQSPPVARYLTHERPNQLTRE
ncbi:hypothetical protein QN379_17975, partial [Glaciimonas sp. Gout2]|uniref:hypothetical protein n=1 Tax=Glaciimonas sp. Gout2 TaxID=3048625 RepID=UPI002B2382B7